MSEAQTYCDGLIGQGYSPADAVTYTQQHFPDFTGAAPAAAAPAMQDSVVGRDLHTHTGNVVHHHHHAAPVAAVAPMPQPMMGGAPAMGGVGMMSAPAAASGGGGPLGYVAVACIVLTLVFSTWGVLGSEWLTMSEDADADTGAPAIEMHASLSTSYAEIDGMDCTSELVEAMGQGECDGDAFAMSYSDLCDDTEDDDTCDAASAGTAGSITLWIAVAAGLGATILIIFNVFGIGALPVDTQKLGMIAGIAAGALAGIAVLVWYLMLPDTDDMTLGLNVWLTITGAVTGIVAGVLAKTHGNPSA